jgi:hypothetical protein
MAKDMAEVVMPDAMVAVMGRTMVSPTAQFAEL